MANAFSGQKTNDDISFNKTNYVKTSSNWITDQGTVTTGSELEMSSDSKCHLNVTFHEEKVDYLKLQLRLSSNDTSLTTDNFHAVTGIYEVTVEKEENNQTVSEVKIFSFYPKYEFEESFIDDYTIVQLGSNYNLKSVKVSLINEEDVTIKFTKTGLFISKVMDEETVNDAVKEQIETNQDIKDYINNMISDKIAEEGFTIRLLNSQAELSTIKEGELCRCAWIS